MTYDLILGDIAYSSWSLRAWLLFDQFGIPHQEVLLDFSTQDVGAQLDRLGYAPCRTVPALSLGNGVTIADTSAIAEELASRHPEHALWPRDPQARAVARMLVAEMHSGFMALRSDHPMNLRVSYAQAPVSKAVLADLARLCAIWAHARAVCAPSGPWLCGDYGIVDAAFAPVAARIAGYNLPVEGAAAAYVAAHLAHPSFLKWRARGLATGKDLPWYARDWPQRPWPHPA